MASNFNVKTKNTTILQWNANSLFPKIDDFQCLLLRDKIHIAVVSETWLSSDRNLNIGNYNVIRKDRLDSYGGLCVFIHKSVKALQKDFVHPNSSIEMIVIEIFNIPGINNIISIYCPPSSVTNQSDWHMIFDRFDKGTLIIGDFNAHHITWSNKTDRRGEMIYNSCFDKDYMCLNSGNATRIKLVNGVLQQSSPDASFASTDIATRICWQTTNESLGSDHIVIKMKYGYDSAYNFIKRRNFKEARWSEYREKSDEVFGKLDQSLNVQECYNIFASKIDQLAEETIPWIQICQDPTAKFVPKPYWNSELSRAVAERRLALARLRRNPTPDNYNAYKTKINAARKLVRCARAKGWKEFCTNIDSETSASEMWRKMKWVKGGKFCNRSVDSQKCTELLQSLTPDLVCEQPPLFMMKSSAIDREIALFELENCLKRKDTSPGIDNISYSMVFNLSVSGKKFLLHIYNLILHTGVIPSQWRSIRVVPIPKPGRDPNSSSSLRPISLMSCPCKIFHSILLKRLEWFVEKSNLLSPSTIGFRRSHSCLDNLSRLITSIQIAFSKNRAIIACFVDINNAYNNVNINKMISMLESIGVGSKVCKYIFSYLSRRYLQIDTGVDGIIVRQASVGLAQGDPLSPLLFNIVTMNICKLISTCKVSQYADDFVLYVSSNKHNLDPAIDDLRIALDILVKNLGEMGLFLSESKTNVCLFSRSRNLGNVRICINNKQLKVVDRVKYLGLWLDSSLRWGVHINEICEKAYKHLNILKILAGKSWGVHPKHLRRLYISLVRSRIDYASFLYGNSAKTHLNKLDVLQNRALRICGGFIRTTPICVMESELCLPPLYVRRHWLACRYWLRVNSFSHNVTVALLKRLSGLCTNNYWRKKKKPILVDICNKFGNNIVHKSHMLDMYNMDTWVTNVNIKECIFCNVEELNVPKRSTTLTNLRTIMSNMLVSRYNNYYFVFTDGSKDAHGVGASFFDVQTNTGVKFKLCNDACIMRAELTAIVEALSYIQSLQCKNVVILSDSKSALQHLMRCVSGVRGMPVAYDALKIIHILQNKKVNIKLQWITSHVGIFGNEVADKLAVEAITDGIIIPSNPYFTELIPSMREFCFEMWKNHFNVITAGKGLWYRTIQQKLPRIPWSDVVSCSRELLVLAFRIRSGHVPTNSFLHLMGVSPSPLCNFCLNKLDDLYHILLECSAFDDSRPFLGGMLRNDVYSGGVNILLGRPFSEQSLNIYKFVRGVFLRRDT